MMPEHGDSRVSAVHSIRLRVMAATLVLALGGLGFAGTSLWGALGDRREARALAQTSHVLATLSRATIELSLERSASQVSIEVPGTVSTTLRQLIDRQRGRADTGLDQALQESAEVTTTEQASVFRDEISALRAKLAPIRQEFDRLNAVPLADRPADRIHALPGELKAVVVQFQAARHLLRGPGYRLPTDVAMLEAIRDQAWQIREFGGRERTYLAIAVATPAPIAAPRIAEMDTLAHRVDDAWLDITRIGSHGGLAESVRSAIQTVRDNYFGSYLTLRKTLLAEAQKPAPAYPQDFGTFFTQSSQALAGAEALAATASSAIADYWVARASATLHTVVADAAAALLLVAVALASGTMTAIAFRRLDALRARMQALAAGDMQAEVPHVGSLNEIGAMAGAVRVFRETARERAMLEAATEYERAEADRRRAATERHTHDFTESLAGVMRELAGAARRMDVASTGMAQAAARTGDIARTTTEGASASARDLLTVSSATEQMTATVREISEQVARAAGTARDMAARSADAERTMTSLAQAAERIDDVARLIAEIAGQTNLLALNATIEAARAGEAGRGFAVVAAEVKLLASRTAAATGEIATQIGGIQSASGEAVVAVRQMATEVRHMEEMAAAIAAAVEQQGAGVREIAGNIASVSRMTETAVGDLGHALDAAEEARSISTEVREAAVAVGTESDTLGKEVDHFLVAMRETTSDKRQYHRYPGNDAPVRLHLADGAAVPAGLIDVSRGGVAVMAKAVSDVAGLASGASLAAELPGLSEHVPMRVVRVQAGRVALVARQQAGVSEQMERVITALGGLRQAA